MITGVILEGIRFGVFWFMALSIPIGSLVLFLNMAGGWLAERREDL